MCETCNGEGELFVDGADSRGEHRTDQVPCPDCDGGEIDLPRRTVARAVPR